MFKSGFELTTTPSPIWVDLSRDLIATAVSGLDLSVDRLNDLLVLSDRVVSDAFNSPGIKEVRVTVGVDDNRLTAEVAVRGLSPEDSAPGRVAELAMSILADEHWARPTGDGTVVGFALTG